MVNISWDLQSATRSGYGYTAEDPIRMGFSKDFEKNVDLCKTYLAGLRTSDQQPFQIVERASVRDPKNKPKRQKFLGLPLRNSVPTGGLLDLYLLVSIYDTDTVSLYFDIYHKDSLRVPRDLQFVAPTPAR